MGSAPGKSPIFDATTLETNDGNVKIPTFESLPRELRQEIVKIVFHETVAAGLEFNRNIRRCIAGSDHTIEFRYDLPDFFKAVLFTTPKKGAVSAPYTAKTAYYLTAVFPDIMEDIQFILKLSLQAFEQNVVEAMTEAEQEERNSDHAVGIYGARASEKEEMRDYGLGLLRGEQTAHLVSYKMEGKFDRVIEQLYG